jgi:hypothetical protein
MPIFNGMHFLTFNLSSLRCGGTALWLIKALCRTRIFTEQIRRSDGTRCEIAAAIRAYEIKPRFDAVAAKRAFKSANHRLS